MKAPDTSCTHAYGMWSSFEKKSSGYDNAACQYWDRVETMQSRECAECGWIQVAPLEVIQ